MAAHWRKLRAAALVLRLLRSKRTIEPSTTQKMDLSSDGFPFQRSDCCNRKKEELLRHIIAKPIHCRSEVDIKLLAGILSRCRFNNGLSSASTDALARALHFRVIHDGEILFCQGDAIEEASEHFLVVRGSLLLFSHQQSAGTESTTNRGDALHKFDECLDTCNPGSTCGEDIITGAIARKTTAMAQTTTLVAFVTKADYLRIARFNVESEVNVLSDVSHFFKKTTTPGAPLLLDSEALLDRESARVVKRFLYRYECFRTLPHETLLRLAQKLQLHTFNAGEKLYPIMDNVPRLYFILSGKCCVHLFETTEERLFKASEGRENNTRGFNDVRSTPKTFDNNSDGCVCCNETHYQTPSVTSTTHICTLVGGDSFGEAHLSRLAVIFECAAADGAILSVPRSSSSACYVVSVSIIDFLSVRSCYLDSIRLETTRAYAILSSDPRDRTCEQISYLGAYLTSRSSTKLLFGQFPPTIVREICRHATLKKYVTTPKVLVCVQEKGNELKDFRIVLDGRIVILKTPDHSDFRSVQSTQPNKEASISTVDSRNLDLLLSGSSSNRPTSVNNFVQPVGVLSPGNAFGLLPLLLNSTSAYSYIAYAAPDSGGAMVNILSIPDSVTKLYFSTIARYLVFRPVRALQHVFRSARATPQVQVSNLRKRQALNDFERLILRCPVVFGIPRPKLRAMIDRMLVVSVPAHYFLFEAGEYTKGCVFIILEGSVRTLRCPVAFNNREPKTSNRLKGGSQDGPRLVREATEDFFAQEVTLSSPEHAVFTFTKPVDDDFFGREYKYVQDLENGDGFGRYGSLEVLQIEECSTRNRSSKLNSLLRKATSRRLQVGNQLSSHSVYPETAITTSNCRLGVLWSDRADASELVIDPEQKMELTRFMEIGCAVTIHCNSSETIHDQRSNEEIRTASVLKTRCHIIERMGIAKGMKTDQVVQAAKALKYLNVRAGDTVYRQDEEGTALYFILSGRVRLSSGQEHTPTKAKATLPVKANDFWSIDLFEGDIFGEEFLLGGITSTTERLTTAVAIANAQNDESVKLMYLSLSAYLSIFSLWEYFTHSSRFCLAQKAKDQGSYSRSAIERWKAAVFQIVRVRRPLTSVLQGRFYHRTQVTFSMVHQLPLFKDIPSQQCLEMCKYCSVEAVSQDSSVFKQGDDVLDQCYLIISGSVIIQQVASHLQILANPGLGEGRGRVSVRVMKSGDSFGEVELLLSTSTRLTDAIVSNNNTKLLRVPKDLFLQSWPVREHLKSKLTTIKRAFDAASPLEPEQLCSMYYSANDCSFKRNDVVFGANTQRGTLLIIESGFCVVHDYITLQRKRPRKPAQRDPGPKLELDTKVATLGPSTIMFAESDLSDTDTALGGEYVVADSPVVNAFTVALYSRHQDLLTGVLFGRGGLQTVRAAMATQRDRRTESTAVLARFAESTAPKEKSDKVSSRSGSPLKQIKPTRNMKSPEKTPMKMELQHYLRDRELPQNSRQICNNKGSIPLATVGPTPPPKKSLGLSSGSFGLLSLDSRAKGLFPALRPGDYFTEHESQCHVDPIVAAASMRNTQLIKETRVIAALSHQSHKTLGPTRLSTATDIRQRHGRPPSRQLESRDRMFDILTPDANCENLRRKTGLCRRLLHIKSSDDHK